jgi:hypothetical protein
MEEAAVQGDELQTKRAEFQIGKSGIPPGCFPKSGNKGVAAYGK